MVPSRSLQQGRLETRPGAEQAGQQKVQDRPEIELAVFQRRAGQDESMPRPDGEAGVRHLRIRILDELPFVEHGVTEFELVEQGAVVAQLRVTGEPDPGAVLRAEIVTVLQDKHAHVREEAPEFLLPDGYHAGGAHHQVTASLHRSRREERTDLDRLAQAHLVGQQCVTTVIAEVGEPLDSTSLIRTEHLGQAIAVGLGRQQAFAPGLEFGRERELETLVVEEGKEQVGGERAGTDALRRVAPLLERGEVGGLQGDETDLGNDDGAAVGRPQVLQFRLTQKLFAGAEDPFEINLVSVDGGAAARPGLDLHGVDTGGEPGDGRFLLDLERASPGRHDDFQEVRNLRNICEQVGAEFRLKMKMRFSRQRRQGDQLHALGGARRRSRVLGSSVAVAVA